MVCFRYVMIVNTLHKDDNYYYYYPASFTMGTGSFPGVKRLGQGVDHPPPSSAEVKERVELYLYSPSELHGLF
jgi:hypothetical protein